jgi:hypothetical protein
MRPRCRTVLLLCLVALLLPARPHADTPRRVLHVSLYPYIPDPSDAALTLKQGFEHQYPDVIVDITFNRNYYSPESADHGVLFETADRGKLAPLPPALAAAGAGLEPLAAQSATLDGRLVAVPHWMCADFLIYRADQSGLAGAPTLAAMEHALGSSHGLLMDLKGADTLGEYDLAALLARYGTAPAALSHAATPDPYITARLRRFLALEPPGFGRNADYDARGSFYARQFARRAGSAFVGYSEMTHEVLDETAVSCQDGTIHPAVWVDMFVIDAAVHGQSLQDAADFITYAVSLPAYRALLIPQPGDSPRYLLPATQAAFADPHILGTAPLYPSFRAILERGAVIIAPHLSATLHAAAAALDAALPERH